MTTQLETQLGTLETRAVELRAKLDDAAAASAALDARLAQGEFDRAGDAANKRAELESLNRALETVERDAQRVQSELDAQAAAAARRAHLDAVTAIAQGAADLDTQAQDAAAELARQIEKDAAAIWAMKCRADGLRAQLTRIANDDPAIFQEDLSLELTRRIGYQGMRENYPEFAPVQIVDNFQSIGGRAVGAALGALAAQELAARNAKHYAKPRGVWRGTGAA
jgi:chromosome segregation ATPase